MVAAVAVEDEHHISAGLYRKQEDDSRRATHLLQEQSAARIGRRRPEVATTAEHHRAENGKHIERNDDASYLLPQPLGPAGLSTDGHAVTNRKRGDEPERLFGEVEGFPKPGFGVALYLAQSFPGPLQ